MSGVHIDILHCICCTFCEAVPITWIDAFVIVCICYVLYCDSVASWIYWMCPKLKNLMEKQLEMTNHDFFVWFVFVSCTALVKQSRLYSGLNHGSQTVSMTR